MSLEQIEKELDEEINKLSGDITKYNPEPNSINLPVEDQTQRPQIEKPVLHTLEEGKKKKKVQQEKQKGSVIDRTDNKHLPKGKQVHTPKTLKPPKYKEKFQESVNVYLMKTSREMNIGMRDLENFWTESKNEILKTRKDTNTRAFWEQVKKNFDTKVNKIFLEEAKKTMTSKKKLSEAITRMIDHISQDKYIEAKEIVREAANHCLESMICERKVHYQKQLAEQLSKKLKEN